MSTKDFDGWNAYKKELENKLIKILDPLTGKYRFKVGEVWFCSIGVNLGTEVNGKNQYYERPVLVIQKSGRHFLGVALTSKKPKNPYHYYDLSYHFDDQKVESYALLIEIRSYDVLRLTRRVKRVSDSDYLAITEKIKSFF